MAKDTGASVRDRLLQKSRQTGENFQWLLQRFAVERLLYRLTKSDHASRFVLKGATLFVAWTGRPHRATRDLDLLGFGSSDPVDILKVFTEVLALQVEDDGLGFAAALMQIGPIREDQEYGGLRVVIPGRLSTAKVQVQVDIGFGDVVTPGAELVEITPLLAFPPPRMRAYPKETVVAEKVQALVQLGMANSRMKDFYDLAVLASMFEFDGAILAEAIQATFERRGTLVPAELPVGLTSTFAQDPHKQSQWAGFIRKSGTDSPGDLAGVIAKVAAFVGPALLTGERLGRWPMGGPWTFREEFRPLAD